MRLTLQTERTPTAITSSPLAMRRCPTQLAWNHMLGPSMASTVFRQVARPSQATMIRPGRSLTAVAIMTYFGPCLLQVPVTSFRSCASTRGLFTGNAVIWVPFCLQTIRGHRPTRGSGCSPHACTTENARPVITQRIIPLHPFIRACIGPLCPLSPPSHNAASLVLSCCQLSIACAL